MKNLLCIVALLALVPIAYAQSPLQKELQREHDRQVSAFNKKDVAGFMAHYSPELKVTPVHGAPMDFATWKGFIADIAPGVRRVVKHQHKIIKLVAEGPEWRSTVDEHEAYDIKDVAGMFGEKNKPHHLTNHSQYEEVWTKTKTGWKVRELKMLSEKQTLDGKPFPMAG